MSREQFKNGIITLSFDDGRKDTFRVFMDILKPRKIPGVVYIPSGYIETRFSDPLEIGYNGVMTKRELDIIKADSLFEIGGHGYMHKNDFKDTQKGVDKLREWYPEIDEIGLASPHSEITEEYVLKNKEKYIEMGFKYVRGGRNFAKYTMPKRFISLVARKTKSPGIFCTCYKSSMNANKSYYLKAIPIHKLTTYDQVKAIIDCCIKYKKWAILEYHGIDKSNTKEYSEEFCWLEDDFIKICNYIVKKRDERVLDIKNPLTVL